MYNRYVNNEKDRFWLLTFVGLYDILGVGKGEV